MVDKEKYDSGLRCKGICIICNEKQTCYQGQMSINNNEINNSNENIKKYLIVCDNCDECFVKAESAKEAFIKFLDWIGYTQEKYKSFYKVMNILLEINDCIELFEQISKKKITCFVELINEIRIDNKLII